MDKISSGSRIMKEDYDSSENFKKVPTKNEEKCVNVIKFINNIFFWLPT